MRSLEQDVSTYVQCALHEVKGKHLEQPFASEFAHAVAHFFVEEYEDQPVESSFLWFQISQALVELGEEELGLCLLERQMETKAQLYARTLLKKRGISWPVYRACLQGVLVPFCWSRSRLAEGSWSLNLSNVLVRNSDNVELALYPFLRNLLKWISGIWDEHQGEGVLALKGARAWVTRGLGHRPSSPRGRFACKELRSFCELVLTTEARQRAWSSKPEVMLAEV